MSEIIIDGKKFGNKKIALKEKEVKKIIKRNNEYDYFEKNHIKFMLNFEYVKDGKKIDIPECREISLIGDEYPLKEALERQKESVIGIFDAMIKDIDEYIKDRCECERIWKGKGKGDK